MVSVLELPLTDAALIDHAACFDLAVTPRQLKAWRREGAMPPEPTLRCPERLVALCLFLRRQGTFRSRGDLPDRRRVADAPLWLWYEGIPIPIDEMRDRVLAYLEQIDHELTALRAFAERQTPGLERYEYVSAAAERYADEVMHTNLLPGMLPAFSEEVSRDEEGPVIPPKPHDLARDGLVQLFCCLQDDANGGAENATRVLDAALTTSGVDALSEDVPDAATMLEALTLRGMTRALWALTERDLWSLRHTIHAALGMAQHLANHTKEPSLRRLGKLSTRVPIGTRSLLFGIANFAAMGPYITEFLNTNPVESPPEWLLSSPLPEPPKPQ